MSDDDDKTIQFFKGQIKAMQENIKAMQKRIKENLMVIKAFKHEVNRFD